MSSAPAQAAPTCPHCGGSGFRPAKTNVAGGFAQGVVACQCKPSAGLGRGHEIPITHEELERRIAFWLKAGCGPTRLPFTEAEAELLRLLGGHIGQRKAVSIREIQKLLPGTEREIKQRVRDLRLQHRIKVGSLRGYRRRLEGAPRSSELYGYFLCTTEKEVLDTYYPRLHEALATLEICDALTEGRAGLAELLARARGFVQQKLPLGAKP